uniref:Uncharacterized protein n=1 Tax=Corethron hystrix TaxID=216773 RepID=A0A7S1FL38_9STRA|mmetsp:Transcript_13063/g.28810  ORF Transcript_13063/g.28810 Transcript_13063/m.28810 type:complete len:157 (+) Transcript_13063:212-682(+)
MIGRLMSPVLKSMANEFARQGEEIDLLLEDARSVIGNDSAAISALGEPFSCSRPFQQSASSISINGKMKKSIDVRFEVMGSHGSGIASMSAVGNQSKETVIENLVIAMSNGRSISIKNLNPRRRRGSYDTVPGSPSSDIIDVECEEKKIGAIIILS